MGWDILKIVALYNQCKKTYGFVSEHHVLLKTTVETYLKQTLPRTVEDFITDYDLMDSVKKCLPEIPEKFGESDRISLTKTRVLAPLSNPPKILCLGLNYINHAEEQGTSASEDPTLFMKPRTAINGPYDEIIKPKWVNQLDYECELAVVIGKRGKEILESEAMKYILGYMVINDVSARDIQYKDKQWTRGKSFDTFAPLGPWITTADEIRDPHRLTIKTLVNGEIRQNSSTEKMFIKIPQIICSLSRVMTLEPGDVIATGTPAGVGIWMKPTPRFLKDGDVVEMSISGLGSIKNMISQGI